MADMMQFDLVSPERKLASLLASEVQIPGSEGDMTAMPDHAPTITTLRAGIVRAIGAEGTQEYMVTGGFAEITASSTTVLAEHAVPRDEVTREMLEEIHSKAKEAQASAAPEAQDMVTKAVADIVQLMEDMA